MIRKQTTFLLILVLTMVAAVAVAYPVIDPNESMVRDSAGYPSWGADTAVNCNVNSTAAGPLANGFYIISCGNTAWGDQGTSTVAAAYQTERRLPANSLYPVRVTGASDTYIALLCTALTQCTISRDDF